MLTKIRGARVSRPLIDKISDLKDVLYYRAKRDGGDDTPAFQRAIDAAYESGVSTTARAAMVVVPYRRNGYRIGGLNMRSGVHLVGQGTVLLFNPTDKDTIILDGAIESAQGGNVLRRTVIENFVLFGTDRSGYGFKYVEHADNILRNVRVKAHGAGGIIAQKAQRGFNSDGLVLQSVWIDDNRGVGLEFGTNSHYCSLSEGCRLANNDGGNAIFRGVNHTMTGGVFGSGTVSFENVQGGCFSGVAWEATPSQQPNSPMIDLVDGVRGLTFMGCYPHVSGSTVPVTLIRVGVNTFRCTMYGGFMDANSAADCVGVDNSAGGSFLLDNVMDGGNVGTGAWTFNMGATVRAYPPYNPS